MDFKIFYAWQSDRSQKNHRYLIRDVASEAVKRIGRDADIEDSPRLDHDTQDVSGTPEIAGTIYKKIEDSSIFLADLTFVGSVDLTDAKKLVPNPNVTLELGYAARSIGWERIICVMNTAFGPAEALMFDLQHRRWPICYKLEGEDSEAIRITKKVLGEQIEIALRSAMNSEHQAVEDASRRLSTETIMFMGWHAHHDVFWNDSKGQTILQAAALGFIDHAIDRLLDLKLIDCFFDPDMKKFVYRWTYIGKLVLKKLDIKPRSSPDFTKAVSDNPLTEAESPLVIPSAGRSGGPQPQLPAPAKRCFKEMTLRNRLLCALFPNKFPDR
jgi:hypothetical protein